MLMLGEASAGRWLLENSIFLDARPTGFETERGSAENHTGKGLGLAVSVLASLPPDQMAVAKLVPEIPIVDGFGVRLLYPVEASDGAEHREVACDGVM